MFLSSFFWFLIALGHSHLWVPQNIKVENNRVTEHKLIINDMLTKLDQSDLKREKGLIKST